MAAFFASFANHSPSTTSPLDWLGAKATVPQPTVRPQKSATQAAATDLNPALRIEILDRSAAQQRTQDWADLISRSIEKNVFMEPGFALTLAQHSPSARRPVFMLIYAPQYDGQPELLVGLLALATSPAKTGAMAACWRPNLSALGTPLLDRVRGAEALASIFDWFENNAPRTAGLMFSSVPAHGPTARMIRARAHMRHAPLQTNGEHSRAILHNASDCSAMWSKIISPKRNKELNRQSRRLSDIGELKWVCESEPGEVRNALERFLTLEAGGWKGARGTALLRSPGLATFSRAMTRTLARSGQCNIYSLELDGRPIAMGIALSSGKSAALWKIAYDEDFAHLSPGVQFVREFTKRQVSENAISFTDSCAIADHPMIDGLWMDRMPVVDLFAAVSLERADAFRSAAARELLKDRAWRFAKSALRMSRGKPDRKPVKARSAADAVGNHIS